MMILDTTLNDNEKKILFEYAVTYEGKIKIFITIDEKKLFYEGVVEGEKCCFVINSPHRLIEIGGQYLLEEKDNIGIWCMGDYSKERGYIFWGEYGSLENAIRSL